MKIAGIILICAGAIVICGGVTFCLQFNKQFSELTMLPFFLGISLLIERKWRLAKIKKDEIIIFPRFRIVCIGHLIATVLSFIFLKLVAGVSFGIVSIIMIVIIVYKSSKI